MEIPENVGMVAAIGFSFLMAVGMMANCSIKVAAVDSQAQIACLQGGGVWAPALNRGGMHDNTGHCHRPEPKKAAAK